MWYRNPGGSEDDCLNGLLPLNDGHFLAYGYTASHDKDIHDNHGETDGYVIKLSDRVFGIMNLTH